MTRKIILGSLLISSSLLFTDTMAFVANSLSFVRKSASHLNLLHGSFLSEANNLCISTIDSDIASISDDQFGLVFAGGIAVMVGGVLSAVIVGFLLEKGDLYASVAAESYLQSEDDEEFWKGLSDEEQVKAKDLMEKIRASKEGGGSISKPEPSTLTLASTTSTTSASIEPLSPSKPTDMFNDYGD